MIMSDGCLYIEQSSSSCEGGAEAAEGAGATKTVIVEVADLADGPTTNARQSPASTHAIEQ